MSYYKSQRLNGEMVSNWIQGTIKGSLGRTLEGMNEVNWDGRAIKGSHIRVSEENMEMTNCEKQSVLKQILSDISS